MATGIGAERNSQAGGMKAWLRSDIGLMLRRLALLYLVLAVCRIVFYFYNRTIIGPISWDALGGVLSGSLMFDTVSIIYINALWILLSLLPTRLRSARWYRCTLFSYYIAVNSVAILINLADAIYFHYAQKRFTSEEIFFASNDNSGFLMLKFAAENWYLVVIAAMLIWGLVVAYGRKIIPHTPIKSNVLYYSVNTAVLLIVCYLCFGGLRGGFTRMTRPVTLSNAMAYVASPEQANLVLSNPFCILRTWGNKSIVYTKYYPESEIEGIFTPYHYPDTDEAMPDSIPSFAGRNVVFFVLESFSAEHSALLNPDLYPDGKGFTPFLDSLMRSGFTFTDAHANGHKSIEALPSLLSSIPTFKTPFVLMPQSIGPMQALPAVLDGEGYSTAFFCGSMRGSMGFEAYANLAGIRQVYGKEDYEKYHGTGDFDNYWGIWDEPFLQYMGEELGRMHQPFMSSVFTLSSHHPFVVPAQYVNTLPSGPTKVNKGVAYTDMAIRKFFARYCNEEWFRNTVFIFSADHVSSETWAPKTRTPTGGTHIINFIYVPDGSLKMMYKGVSQQADMMPTLLGLMRYHKPYFAYGRDLLGEPGRYPIAVSYTGQEFQGITSQYAFFFNEKEVTSAYARADSLQQHDVKSSNDPALAAAEKQLKAIIQQYYSHIEKKNYLAPPKE